MSRFHFTDLTGAEQSTDTVEEIASLLADNLIDPATVVHDSATGTLRPASELAALAGEPVAPPPPPVVRPGFRFNWTAALMPMWLAYRGFWILQVGMILVAFSAMELFAELFRLDFSIAFVLAYILIGAVEGAGADALIYQRGLKHSTKGSLAGVVVVLVVVFGFIWWTAFASHGHERNKAYMAAMKSDLRNLVTAEESYFADSVTYTRRPETATSAGVGFSTSNGVTVTIGSVSATGWNATASHRSAHEVCGIWVGSAPPPIAGATEGVPVCMLPAH